MWNWIMENPILQVLETHFLTPFHVFPTTFSLWGTSSLRRKKPSHKLAFSLKDLGRCKTMQFSIDLTNETPIYWRRHKLSKHEWELVDERCK
jgi:hypothetical protein